MRQVRWLGKTECDVCKQPIKSALFDARHWGGSWATMCKTCWMNNAASHRLGTGYGQRYSEQDDGTFLKAEG